jgi:hypothetical protein
MYNLQRVVLLVVLLAAFCQFGYSQELNQSVSNETTKINKWRISAGVGFGYRVADFDQAEDNMLSLGFDSEAVDDYIKNIRSGYKITGQIHYMFWEKVGLGLDYYFFNSSADIEGYIPSNEYYSMNIVYLRVEDNTFTNYIGASALTESRFGKDKFKLNSQFSVGYTMYRDEVLHNRRPTVISGNSVGINFELGLEYFVLRNLSVGTNLNLFLSTLSKIKVDNGNDSVTVDLEDEEKESLNRVDMSININYYF